MLDRLLKLEAVLRQFFIQNPLALIVIVALPAFLFLMPVLVLNMPVIIFIVLYAVWIGLFISFCLLMMWAVYLGEKREQK